MRRANPDHVCLPGSGRFSLLSKAFFDRDGDGVGVLEAVPVQVSGGGQMTTAAWISTIDVVQDGGYDLRVIESDALFSFDALDMLVDSEEVSFAVEATNAYSPGEVGGHPPFVIEELHIDEAGPMLVDMSWTCGASAEEVLQPPGYVLELSQLGCGVPQDLVVRPLGGGERVAFELYGLPNIHVDAALEQSARGQEFSLERGGFAAAGAILASGPAMATVVFDELSYLGAPVCSTGSYGLLAE